MYIDSVIPLYLVERITKKCHSVGSAVLISHHSQFFFITAAHVIEKLKREVAFIYFERTLYPIAGLPFYLSPCSPFGCRNKDPIDLAAMILPEGLVEKSNNAKFITIDQYLSGMSVESPGFQALGYPHSKNTKAARRTVRIPGGFRTEALRLTVVDISYIALPYKNFDKQFHIATELTKTGRIQGSNMHVNIPDLHGMSGGLLQKVSHYNQDTDGFDCAYPAGIILEKKKDNSTFFSLRLSAVFEWLDHQWEYIFRDTAEVIKKGGVTIPVFLCIFNGHESITSFTKDFDVGMYEILPNLYAVSIANKRGSSKNIDAGFIIKTTYTHDDPEFCDVITGVVESSQELKKFVAVNTSFFPARLKVAGSEPLSENEMLRIMFQQKLKFSTDDND